MLCWPFLKHLLLIASLQPQRCSPTANWCGTKKIRHKPVYYNNSDVTLYVLACKSFTYRKNKTLTICEKIFTKCKNSYSMCRRHILHIAKQPVFGHMNVFLFQSHFAASWVAPRGRQAKSTHRIIRSSWPNRFIDTMEDDIEQLRNSIAKKKDKPRL